MAKIKFTKMHGAGNDYIYVYLPENNIPNPEQASIAWSRYHFGIGSDGLILINKDPNADFSMRIFNNDGSEAMMCGNGIRCVGKYVYDNGLTDKQQISVNTRSGIKLLKLHVDGGVVDAATVDMGEPVLNNRKQFDTPEGGITEGAICDDGREWIGTFVSMGNPHFVIFIDDVMKLHLEEVGPRLEHHAIFPERCNIEFATVLPDGRIRMRVWERGSGITMACGTGACATAVAAIRTHRTAQSATIVMDGGTLQISLDPNDGHVYMTGPATTVFNGEIELPDTL
jgi:diaminopimelate epimerase